MTGNEPRNSRAMAAGLGLAGLLAAGLALAALPAAAVAQGDDEAAEQRLEGMIQQALRADGPFFTDAERAVIERKCGYAPGSWDGFDINASNGVLTCANGRRVDDPEVRAIMEAAGPRIGARVRSAMARPEVRAAISEIAREATATALAALDEAEIEREAAAEAREAAEEAREAAEEAIEDAAEAVEEAAEAAEEAGEEADEVQTTR